MKKVVSETWLFGIVLTFGLLTACGQSAPTWQEQYDLGVRYLSEGSYEEAVIAFTAAIEIDPKQASAYVGRGDAYVGLGETEENLASAQTDYEAAMELDETLAEAYLGLADVYVRRGEYEKALEILQNGLELTDYDPDIADKIAELETETAEDISEYNAYGAVEFTKREEYRGAESLTDGELSMIRTAMALTESEDMQGLHQLAQQYEGQEYFLTLLDGYKILLSVDSSETYLMIFEMRPENGTGYSAVISSGTEGRQSDWCSCVCIDWQWNGTMIERTVLEDASLGVLRLSETGPVENSLRNGTFEVTNAVSGYTYTWKNVYQNGERIEFNGEQEEPDGTRWSVANKYDSSTALEYLYW